MIFDQVNKIQRTVVGYSTIEDRGITKDQIYLFWGS